jgi:hypothetical protein
MQNLRSKIHNRLTVIFLLLAAGCGYSFSGIGEGFPEGVRTVFIERFVNRSRDVTIDWEITTALRSEFHRQRLLQVVDRIDEADAILSGVVRSVETRVVAVNRNDEALQLETALVVDMSLRRRSPDEVLWRTESAKLTETHAASRGAVVTTSSEFKRGTLNPGDLREFTDIQPTETLSRETRERLVEGFAHDLHQRVVEMF